MYNQQIAVEPHMRLQQPRITNRILVVRPEVEILSAFKHVFAAEGMILDTYNTCEQALEMLKTNSYAVLIAEVDGIKNHGNTDFAFLSDVRKKHPTVKIIILTSNGNATVKKRVLEIGASYYFEKPVFVVTIFAALRELRIMN